MSLRKAVTLACATVGPLFFAGHSRGQVTISTAEYNNSRTAANLNEALLTTSNVNTATFGKLFSRVVDGTVYASPLIIPNVAIPGKGTHNVVYVATMNNSVYAFDADDPAQAAPLWFRNLGPSQPSPNGDLQGNWGILGTPVIYNGVIYLVAYVGQTAADWALYLCALDVTTGQDKYGPPAQILFPEGSAMIPATNGTIQRAALLAANNMIYVGFSNFGGASDQSNQVGFVYAYSPINIATPTHSFQPVQQRGNCGDITWRGGDVCGKPGAAWRRTPTAISSFLPAMAPTTAGRTLEIRSSSWRLI